MGKPFTIGSKHHMGFIRFDESLRDKVEITVEFQESFRSGLFSSTDKQTMIACMNEMEKIFLDYTEDLY